MRDFINKTLVFLVILGVVLFFLLMSRGTIEYRSSFLNFVSGPSDCTPCRTGSQPLKVYMYDWPRKYNVGMFSRSQANGHGNPPPLTAKTLPPWPKNSGLKLQHSVEYWLLASLLYEGPEDEDPNGSTREAVRVSNPDLADVFFVPFFSSLSFNTHGHNMTDPATKEDEQLQVDVLKYLRNSSYWWRSEGRDHVIPMHHPNAFRFHKEEVNASILIVSDFGRYPKALANLSKDVVAPYVHVVDSYLRDDISNPYESRPTLLFFRGRTVRKDEGFIRSKLKRILAGYEDVIYEGSDASGEGIKASTKGMRSSKFCLNPAGDTPSSCRLFDAIVSHCVPVIVSNRIELPYEDELDYTKFSIFFSVDEALRPGYMVNELRKISKARWIEMWKELKSISHHFEYQYPPKKEDAVNMIWRQVKHKLPATKLAVHRSRRLKVPDWWR